VQYLKWQSFPGGGDVLVGVGEFQGKITIVGVGVLVGVGVFVGIKGVSCNALTEFSFTVVYSKETNKNMINKSNFFIDFIISHFILKSNHCVLLNSMI